MRDSSSQGGGQEDEDRGRTILALQDGGVGVTTAGASASPHSPTATMPGTRESTDLFMMSRAFRSNGFS